MNLYSSKVSDTLRVSECREIVAALEGNSRSFVALPFGEVAVYQRSRRVVHVVFSRTGAPL